jgi:NADPH-dependent curcumin reductase CurA
MIALVVTHEIHLKERPFGMPTNENFELVEVQIPEPRDGEFLVRNIWMSVDPYMRGRMIERKSYVPQFELGCSRVLCFVITVIKLFRPSHPCVLGY